MPPQGGEAPQGASLSGGTGGAAPQPRGGQGSCPPAFGAPSGPSSAGGGLRPPPPSPNPTGAAPMAGGRSPPPPIPHRGNGGEGGQHPPPRVAWGRGPPGAQGARGAPLRSYCVGGPASEGRRRSRARGPWGASPPGGPGALRAPPSPVGGWGGSPPPVLRRPNGAAGRAPKRQLRNYFQ